MLKIKALVKVSGGFRYEGKVEDLERYDLISSEDELISESEIRERLKEKYKGTPIQLISFEVEKTKESFFANMGSI